MIGAEVLRDIDLYVPPNEPAPPAIPRDSSVRSVMWQKLMSPHGRQHFNRRKTIVEPVFAQIKHVRSLWQFMLRGLAQVEGEWFLIYLTHILLRPI